MKYDVDYFIRKFDKIPEQQWITGHFEHTNGAKCALGHCGENENKFSRRSNALKQLFKELPGSPSVVQVNDGINDTFNALTDLGSHPKERVLNALLILKTGIHKDVV